MEGQPETSKSSPIAGVARKKGPRRLKVWLGAAGLLAVTTCYALLHTPVWYVLPVILPANRQAVRNNLVAAEQAFTENLLAGQPFIYHLFDEDLNRWISMRREISPLLDELVPPELKDPLVYFHDGAITLAGRFKLAGAECVFSLDISASLIDGKILLRAKALRCGSVRLPLALLDNALTRKIDKPRDRVWPGSPPMRGDLRSGVRLDDVASWKNGGMEYRVRDVDVRAGQLNFSIEPLGRQRRTNRSSQF